MRVLPAPDAVIPAQPQCACYHADDFVLALENRSLFDVRLEIRVERAFADGCGTSVANALECFAERDAIAVALLQKMLEGKHSCKGARAAHHRDEPTALLVGPYSDADWVVRDDIGLLEGSKHFQPREHAVIAIEFASRGLRIDMTSSQDHRCRFTAPVTRCEDVACAVDFDPCTSLAQPTDYEIASLPVKIREREATHASLRSRADLRQFHERSPEAVAVDTDRGRHGCRASRDFGCRAHRSPLLNRLRWWMRRALYGSSLRPAASRDPLRSSPRW